MHTVNRLILPNGLATGELRNTMHIIEPEGVIRTHCGTKVRATNASHPEP
jgi:hypothetical protein